MVTRSSALEGTQLGYRLKLVVSSLVSADTRAAIMASAMAHWSFCRGPQDPAAFADRVVFAPPELTDYLFDSGEDEERAQTQADNMEREFCEWSRLFPGVVFACVEADCFGGHCEYRGFCCQSAQQLLVRDKVEADSLVELLAFVGIDNHRTVRAFQARLFCGPGSGGFQ